MAKAKAEIGVSDKASEASDDMQQVMQENSAALDQIMTQCKRVSVLDGSFKNVARVLLDGKEVRNVITADEAEGTVEVIATDEFGRALDNEDPDPFKRGVKTETRLGGVKIEFAS